MPVKAQRLCAACPGPPPARRSSSQPPREGVLPAAYHCSSLWKQSEKFGLRNPQATIYFLLIFFTLHCQSPDMFGSKFFPAPSLVSMPPPTR